MKTTTQKASFAKLNTGAWGVRIAGAQPSIGDTVLVSKRDGSTKTVRVTKVVWSGNGTHLCAIADDRQQQARPVAQARRSSTSGRCRDCHGALVNAPHHRAMGGLCGQCAFDEYDC